VAPSPRETSATTSRAQMGISCFSGVEDFVEAVNHLWSGFPFYSGFFAFLESIAWRVEMRLLVAGGHTPKSGKSANFATFARVEHL